MNLNDDIIFLIVVMEATDLEGTLVHNAEQEVKLSQAWYMERAQHRQRMQLLTAKHKQRMQTLMYQHLSKSYLNSK